MKNNIPIKSLGPMTPRIDLGLKAKLASGNGTGKVVAAVTNPAGVQQTPTELLQKSGNSRILETRQPGPPVIIKVELFLEVVDAPEKHCPAWAYLGRKDPPGIQRIVAVLNRAMWPAAAALARNDGNALRWLVAGAILDRCLTWAMHPVLYAVNRYLARAGLGEGWQDYQRGVWAAYSLKDHALFAGIIPTEKLERSPEKFAQFNVEVDSLKLESFRSKFAKKQRNLHA